mmetsp:Transcript_22307/g.69685  ORF Transcript_22307/g.69685 Transcript_22307/m.69685 type:complete len:256 (-) Transcript_22307:351-1118(-)
MPATTSMKLVLPLPEGPMRPRHSPACATPLTSDTIRRPVPAVTVRPSKRSSQTRLMMAVDLRRPRRRPPPPAESSGVTGAGGMGLRRFHQSSIGRATTSSMASVQHPYTVIFSMRRFRFMAAMSELGTHSDTEQSPEMGMGRSLTCTMQRENLPCDSLHVNEMEPEIVSRPSTARTASLYVPMSQATASHRTAEVPAPKLQPRASHTISPAVAGELTVAPPISRRHLPCVARSPSQVTVTERALKASGTSDGVHW